MKLNNTKAIKNLGFFLVLIFSLLATAFKVNENILFILNLIAVVFIIIEGKGSYFTIKTIIVNYILLALFFQYNFGESYGLLQITSLEIFYNKICAYLLIYNSILYLFLINSNILKKEKEKLSTKYTLNNYATIFLCIVAIASIIIAFPRLPFTPFSSSGRFSALIPGNAWNHLTIVCLLFLLSNLKNSKFTKFTYIFCIFWFLSHYERVDIIGLLACVMIIYFIKNNLKITIKSVLKYGAIVLTVVFIMVAIGEYRKDSDKDITLQHIIRKTVIQNTASDIAYVFNLSVLHHETYGNLNGITYKNLVKQVIPLTKEDENSSTLILKNNYPYPGGEFILGEPLMNFGLVGIIIFQIIELIILNALLSSRSKISYYWYIFILACAFRIHWYGISYVFMGFIYFIPLIYLSLKFIFNDNNTKLISDKIMIRKS